jgi:hypothetical protein
MSDIGQSFPGDRYLERTCVVTFQFSVLLCPLNRSLSWHWQNFQVWDSPFYYLHNAKYYRLEQSPTMAEVNGEQRDTASAEIYQSRFKRCIYISMC